MRGGITYSEVARAAAHLQAQGKMPTVDSVRVELGNTGSKSTIAPFLRQWKERHLDGELGGADGMPAELATAVRNLHKSMQADADARVAEMELASRAREEAHQAELLQLQTALNNAETASQELMLRLEAEKNEVRTLKADNNQLAQQLQELQQEHADLREAAARTAEKMEAARTTYEAQLYGIGLRLDERKQEVSTLKYEAEQLRKDAQAANQRLIESERARGALDEQLAGLKSVLTKFEAERASMADQHAAAAAAWMQKAEAYTAEANTMSLRLAKAELRVEELQSRHERLTDKHAKLEIAFQQKSEEAAILAGRIAQLEASRTEN